MRMSNRSLLGFLLVTLLPLLALADCARPAEPVAYPSNFWGRFTANFDKTDTQWVYGRYRVNITNVAGYSAHAVRLLPFLAHYHHNVLEKAPVMAELGVFRVDECYQLPGDETWYHQCYLIKGDKVGLKMYINNDKNSRSSCPRSSTDKAVVAIVLHFNKDPPPMGAQL